MQRGWRGPAGMVTLGRMSSTSSRAAILVLALGSGLAPPRALAQAKQAEPPAEPTVEATGSAKELLQKIQGYRSWARFSDFAKGPKPSKGHGGAFVIAYHNDVAAKAAQDGKSAFPDGSIVVKENRSRPEGSPGSITTMAKQGGAWFFLKTTPDGKVFTAKGKPVAGTDLDGCTGCHSMSEHDLVFSR